MGPAAASAAPGDLRSPRQRSRIALERVRPGRAPWTFVAAAAGLGVAAGAVALFLALGAGEATTAEQAVRGDATMLSFLMEVLPLQAVRMLAAAATGLGVAGVAVAGRRLLHSGLGGLLAGALVAADAAWLATGHLAVPHTFVLAAAFGALALFLLPVPWTHWVAAALLAVACLFDPWAVAWGAPLAVLVLVRGHIYAAPVHLLLTATQTVAIPGIAALLVVAARQTTAAAAASCLRPSAMDVLLLRAVPDLGGVWAMPAPVTWLAGLVALAGMAAAAAAGILRSFRLARLPGRIQMRLPGPLRPFHARVLWIAALGLAVPHPLAWLPLAALAVAAGIDELAEDAPAFGHALRAVAVLFSVGWLVRAWPLVVGSDSAAVDLLRVVPWAAAVGC